MASLVEKKYDLVLTALKVKAFPFLQTENHDCWTMHYMKVRLGSDCTEGESFAQSMFENVYLVQMENHDC